MGLVTGDRVNLRANPTPSAEVLFQLSKGTKVDVLEKKGAWYALPLPPQAAVFVAVSFLQIKEGAPAEVKGHRVQLRSGPGQAFASLGVLEENQTVQVRKIVGQWAEIAPPAFCRGWVSELYLTYLYPSKDPSKGVTHGDH